MGFSIYSGDVDKLPDLHPQPYRDGECVALVQALTSVGHTSFWRAGPRVVDLSFLNPGAVIANFVFDSKGGSRFPNTHGYHAALFVDFGPRYMSSGMPSHIWVIDQWSGKKPARRNKNYYSPEEAKRQGRAPADNAAEFYVVLT